MDWKFFGKRILATYAIFLLISIVLFWSVFVELGLVGLLIPAIAALAILGVCVAADLIASVIFRTHRAIQYSAIFLLSTFVLALYQINRRSGPVLFSSEFFESAIVFVIFNVCYLGFKCYFEKRKYPLL